MGTMTAYELHSRRCSSMKSNQSVVTHILRQFLPRERESALHRFLSAVIKQNNEHIQFSPGEMVLLSPVLTKSISAKAPHRKHCVRGYYSLRGRESI